MNLYTNKYLLKKYRFDENVLFIPSGIFYAFSNSSFNYASNLSFYVILPTVKNYNIMISPGCSITVSVTNGVPSLIVRTNKGNTVEASAQYTFTQEQLTALGLPIVEWGRYFFTYLNLTPVQNGATDNLFCNGVDLLADNSKYTKITSTAGGAYTSNGGHQMFGATTSVIAPVNMNADFYLGHIQAGNGFHISSTGNYLSRHRQLWNAGRGINAFNVRNLSTGSGFGWSDIILFNPYKYMKIGKFNTPTFPTSAFSSLGPGIAVNAWPYLIGHRTGSSLKQVLSGTIPTPTEIKNYFYNESPNNPPCPYFIGGKFTGALKKTKIEGGVVVDDPDTDMPSHLTTTFDLTGNKWGGTVASETTISTITNGKVTDFLALNQTPAGWDEFRYETAVAMNTLNVSNARKTKFMVTSNVTSGFVNISLLRFTGNSLSQTLAEVYDMNKVKVLNFDAGSPQGTGLTGTIVFSDNALSYILNSAPNVTGVIPRPPDTFTGLLSVNGCTGLTGLPINFNKASSINIGSTKLGGTVIANSSSSCGFNSMQNVVGNPLIFDDTNALVNKSLSGGPGGNLYGWMLPQTSGRTYTYVNAPRCVNADGHLPIDFSNIAWTIRYFQLGQLYARMKLVWKGQL